MKKLFFILLMVSFCFGFIIEHDGNLYDIKDLSDEGFLIFNVLDTDSNLISMNNATKNYSKLGIDSTMMAVLIGELPDSVITAIQPELENNVNALGWIAGGLMTLLGIGWATKRAL